MRAPVPYANRDENLRVDLPKLSYIILVSVVVLAHNHRTTHQTSLTYKSVTHMTGIKKQLTCSLHSMRDMLVRYEQQKRVIVRQFMRCTRTQPSYGNYITRIIRLDGYIIIIVPTVSYYSHRYEQSVGDIAKQLVRPRGVDAPND